jgi:hypothetical protein
MTPVAIAKAQLVPEYFVALPDRRSSDVLIRLLIPEPHKPEN